MTRPRRALLLAFTCGASLLLAGCGLQAGLDQQPGDAGGTRAQASPITAPTIGGTTFSWAATRGHVVVLDFWASWCGPCRAEQAELNTLAATYAGRGVVFLGVDVRDDQAAAGAFRTDLSVPYPSVVDGDELIAAAYNVSAPPTVIVVDQHGTIIDRFLGTLTGVGADLARLT